MKHIHIVAPFHDANGGDWHAIDLYLHLQGSHQIRLWSPYEPHQILKSRYPITQIRPYRGQLPGQGILIIFGALTDIGQWYDHLDFEKTILIHNLFAPYALYKAVHRLTLPHKKPVEIKYVSEMLKITAGLPGEVIYLPPHKIRFRPQPKTVSTENFTVGRISRDAIGKHHFEDPTLYRKLANFGIFIKITGGTCLAPWVGNLSNVELLPEIPQDEVPKALSGFDCFYYRTSLGLKEAFGLVVIEAMLCGLPVVCHRQGGYAEIIEHGVNGFLFDSSEEAENIILELRSDRQLRNKISEKATQLNTGLSDLGLGLENP